MADCATPIARAAVWMRAASNVVMSCLKPWPSTPPSSWEAGTSKPSNPVAQDLDLATRHALGRERIGVGTARLLRQQHGEALVAGLLGVGAHQQRHQVGADGVGDPGLLSCHPVSVALAYGPRLERGEVR